MSNYCINEGLNRIKLLNPNFEYKNWINNIAISPESIPEYLFYEKQNPIIKTSYKISPKQITGTSHPDYFNKSWIEVLGNLKRWERYVDEIDMATDNVLNEKFVDKKSVTKYGENIIISMGNHRCCFSKFLELDEITVNNEEYQFNHDLYSIVNEYNKRGFQIDTDSYRNEKWMIIINGHNIWVSDHLKHDFLEFYDNTSLDFKFIVKYELNQLFSLNKGQREYITLTGKSDFNKIKSHVIAHKSNLSNSYKPIKKKE